MSKDFPELEPAELPGPQPEAAEPEAPVNAVPVTIHMTNGKAFVVDKVQGWTYEEQGIFAVGNFKGYSGETDVLIPYKSVDYLQFDFPALKRYLKKMEELHANTSS